MEKHKELRVMQVVASLEVGGAERVAITLAAGLPRFGWTTELATLAGEHRRAGGEPPLLQDAQRAGIEIAGLTFAGLGDRSSRNRLRSYVRDNGIQLIHAHNRPIDWQLAVLGRWLGIPAIYTRHMVYPGLKSSNRWIYRVAGRLAPAVVCVSDVVADYTRRVEWAPAARLHTIYNGIKTDRFRPATPAERAAKRAELGLADDDFLWFTALRLDPQKGLSFLLRAIAALPANPRRRIMIAGDGRERPALMQLATELGITERIRFLGQRSDVPTILHATDGYLCSSLAEGHPIALLEAMAAGLPIIAPRLAVIREVANEEVALLYGPDQGETATAHDPADIAAAMLRMENDPGLRAAIAKRARNHVVSGYSEDLNIRAHDRLYRQILGRSAH